MTAQGESQVAAALIRVSLDRTRHFGQQEALISPETQRDRCRHFCLARGWQLAEEHIFMEIDVSGRLVPLAERPELQRIFALAAAGTIQRLVVYMFSRLSRRLADTLLVVERLQAAGCHLVSVTEPVDTATEFGRMFLSILQAINQYQAEVTARQVSETWLTLARMGRRPPGKAPYGFIMERGVPRPHPEEHGHLLAAHQALAGTGSVARAVQVLQAAGARPRHGVRWHANTVRGWLRNPFYDGYVVLNGQTYPAGWPPPLPPELRAAARRALPARPGRPPGTAQAHPLAGLTLCRRCGGRFAKYSQRDDSLSCARRGCAAPYVAAAELLAAVGGKVTELLHHPAAVAALTRGAAARLQARTPAEERQRERRLAAGRRQRERLTAALTALFDDCYRHGRITRAECAVLSARYRGELAALEAELAEAEAARLALAGAAAAGAEAIGSLATAARAVWPLLDREGQRAVLLALAAEVHVGPTGVWLVLAGAVHLRLPARQIWRRLHCHPAAGRVAYRDPSGRWTDLQDRFVNRTWGRYAPAAIAARLQKPLRAVRARAAHLGLMAATGLYSSAGRLASSGEGRPQ